MQDVNMIFDETPDVPELKEEPAMKEDFEGTVQEVKVEDVSEISEQITGQVPADKPEESETSDKKAEKVDVKGFYEKQEKQQEEQEEQDVDVEELLKTAIGDDTYRQKAANIMERVDKKLGVHILENPKAITWGNLLEEIIYYMRWSPDYLFNCPIEQLYKYEMVLASHITYVKARENHWETMVHIANRDLKRSIKLVASHCSGRSIGEREAKAVTTYTQLSDLEKKLDMYNIYKDKCKGITDTFIQMDNSLKKTLERRKFEFERAMHIKDSGRQS